MKHITIKQLDQIQTSTETRMSTRLKKAHLKRFERNKSILSGITSDHYDESDDTDEDGNKRKKKPKHIKRFRPIMMYKLKE